MIQLIANKLAIHRVRAEPALPYVLNTWKHTMTGEPHLISCPGNPSKVRCYYIGVNNSNYTTIGCSDAFVDADLSDPSVWEDYPGNPIITDCRRLDDIFEYNGTLYLFGSHNDGSDGISVYTSQADDGIVWNNYADNPILTINGNGRTDSGTRVCQCAIVEYNNLWYMIYGHRDDPILADVLCATSEDLFNWTKTDGILWQVGNAGELDTYYIEKKYLLKLGSKIISTYEAWDNVNYRIHIASSDHPINEWHKSPYKFNFSGIPNTLDKIHVATGGFFLVGGTWWLAYQGTFLPSPYAGSFSTFFAKLTKGLTPLNLIG